MTERYWLPPGTVIKVQGIPLKLEGEAVVQTSPDNWRLVRDFLDLPPLAPLAGTSDNAGST